MQTKSEITHFYIKSYDYHNGILTTTLSNNQTIDGSFLLYKDYVQILPKFNPMDITDYKILHVNNLLNKDLLLIGCGNSFAFCNPALSQDLKKFAYTIDWMTTINAFHTFNLLLEDERDVIGLFIN